MNFICATSDFETWTPPVSNYRLISTQMLDGHYPFDSIVIADHPYKAFSKAFGPMICVNHIWKYVRDVDIYGICLAGKHLNSMETELKDGEAVLPMPLMGNMENRYTQYGDIDDLRLCEAIIDERYPRFTQPYEKINGLYPYNMSIMHSNDFDEYCGFVFGVIDEYIKRMGFTNDDDIIAHIAANTEKYPYGEDTVNGFFERLCECLSTIFFMTHFKDYIIKHRNVVITEK